MWIILYTKKISQKNPVHIFCISLGIFWYIVWTYPLELKSADCMLRTTAAPNLLIMSVANALLNCERTALLATDGSSYQHSWATCMQKLKRSRKQAATTKTMFPCRRCAHLYTNRTVSNIYAELSKTIISIILNWSRNQYVYIYIYIYIYIYM